MKQALTFCEIYFITQANVFLYYLEKIPGLGRLVHPVCYRLYRLKKFISWAGVLLDFIKTALGNNLGVLVLIYLPVLIILPEDKVTIEVYAILFFVVKCLAGPILECGLFNSKAEDYTFLHHFMVNPDIYYRYKAIKETLFDSVLLLPVLFFLCKSIEVAFALVVLKTAGKLIGNVVYMYYYRRFGRLPNYYVRRVLGYGLAVAAYGACYFTAFEGVHLAPFLYIGCIVVGLCLCTVAWWLHLTFTGYKSMAVRFANKSLVSFQVSVSSTIGEDDNGLEEAPWEENRDYFNKNKGKPLDHYLDDVFWQRFGKSIRKGRIAQVIAFMVIFTALGFAVRFGWIPLSNENILQYTPILISATLSSSMAALLSQTYFRNIDIHMMQFHMCTAKYVRHSMLNRFVSLIKCDLALTLASTINMFIFLLASGLRIGLITMLQLSLICGLVLVIWDTYEWMVYYFIQPYSVEFTAKSPLFTVLGVFDSIFNLLLLFIRANITYALPWITGLALIMITGLIISSKYAYRTFKLRY